MMAQALTYRQTDIRSGCHGRHRLWLQLLAFITSFGSIAGWPCTPEPTASRTHDGMHSTIHAGLQMVACRRWLQLLKLVACCCSIACWPCRQEQSCVLHT